MFFFLLLEECLLFWPKVYSSFTEDIKAMIELDFSKRERERERERDRQTEGEEKTREGVRE